MNRYFALLFARPSFLEGAARVLDIGATLQEYNFAASPREADQWALSADWKSACEDFGVAWETFERAHPKQIAAKP